MTLCGCICSVCTVLLFHDNQIEIKRQRNDNGGSTNHTFFGCLSFTLQMHSTNPHTPGVHTYSQGGGGWFARATLSLPLSTCYVSFVIGISCFISMTKFQGPSPCTPNAPSHSVILWSPRAESLHAPHHPPSQLCSNCPYEWPQMNPYASSPKRSRR